MNKFIIILLLFFFQLNASSKSIVVYIGSIDDIGRTIEQVSAISRDVNLEDKFLIFISNGNNPVIIKNTSDLSTQLEVLRIITGITNSKDDIQRLNNVLIDNGFLNPKESMGITFYYFLKLKISIGFDYNQTFIQRFLLSNRYFLNGNIKAGIKVKVFFDNYDNFKDLQIKNTKKELEYINESKKIGYEVQNL